MSRTVDLFLDSDQPLERVAAQLGELTGHELAPLPDGARFVMRDGEVSAYLAEHDFVDDDDLPLSEFRYVLSAAVTGDGVIDDSPQVACLRRASTCLRSIWPSLLVIDLERRADVPSAGAEHAGPGRAGIGPEGSR
jgi:hypothetical protein